MIPEAGNHFCYYFYGTNFRRIVENRRILFGQFSGVFGICELTF
jgi:hypothetical protein